MPINTLAAIQTKVRRLTRAPSEAQLTTAILNEYINTFVVYDFPEHLRTFNLRTTFNFYCNPYQDVYRTDTSVLPVTNPLYDFQNNYLTIHPPVYVAGYPALFTQSEAQFFNIYPKINSIQSIGTAGNGVTTNFTGTIGSINFVPGNSTAPILASNVLFSSIDINNQGLALYDVPNNPFDGTGTIYDANTQAPTPVPGTINYLTGAFNITFPTAPGSGMAIDSQTVPYQPSLPQALLFYANTITLRPVPDQPYKISFEAYKRPTELIGSNAVPELQEWWQYIAYGAAKKVLEDRMDLETVQLIMPEFKKQEVLIQRRTIVQYTNERPATIYTESTGTNGFGSGWGNGMY